MIIILLILMLLAAADDDFMLEKCMCERKLCNCMRDEKIQLLLFTRIYNRQNMSVFIIIVIFSPFQVCKYEYIFFCKNKCFKQFDIIFCIFFNLLKGIFF